MESKLVEKEQTLERLLRSYGSVVVAYSGGVDSSLLAYYARKVLGGKALIVIAKSASLATDELADARAQAEQFDFELVEIETNEIEKQEYTRNDANRCYFCKKTLFEELHELAAQKGISYVAYGANVDDLGDYRPGHKAARELQVVSPLQEAGLEKTDIRALAKAAGLPSWDRPQAACLSSRFPTFEPVTVQGLSQIDRAESFLRTLGFRQLRVRHHGDLARIELERAELLRLSADLDMMQRVSHEFKRLGYKYVTLDMEGYRQGSSNTFLQTAEA